MQRLYDISPIVSPSLAVWPGDTAPTREVLLDMRQGANLTLSTLRTTVHAGAHADAPSHFGKDAPAIDACDLEPYLGRCQVVRVAASPRTRITPQHLAAAVGAERLLIATGTCPDPARFAEDFAALDPGLVDWLHERGVRLVGIDTPSVDLFDDGALRSHQRFLAHDMRILEGLCLDGVAPGYYELVALPLRLAGFDASPVRAVLRTVE